MSSIISIQQHTNRVTLQGTKPFMSTELMEALSLATSPSDSPTFTHELRHDLESVLYIIFFICIFTNGPCSLSYKDGKIRNGKVCPLDDWFKKDPWETLVRTRTGGLVRFHPDIIGAVQPYWNDFIPFLQRLHETAWKPDPAFTTNTLQVDKMVKILDEAIAAVTEEKPIIYPFLYSLPAPDSPAESTSKRPREPEVANPRARPRRRAK